MCFWISGRENGEIVLIFFVCFATFNLLEWKYSSLGNKIRKRVKTHCLCVRVCVLSSQSRHSDILLPQRPATCSQLATWREQFTRSPVSLFFKGCFSLAPVTPSTQSRSGSSRLGLPAQVPDYSLSGPLPPPPDSGNIDLAVYVAGDIF